MDIHKVKIKYNKKDSEVEDTLTVLNGQRKTVHKFFVCPNNLQIRCLLFFKPTSYVHGN